MKNNKTNTANPDKIGIGKFWAWQSRGASAAINFIVVSFVAIYCTDALGMPPALVGTLLAVSTVVDAITDLFAGYLVDRTNTRWGKGRPYEWAIVAEWILTFLMYSTPAGASLAVESVTANDAPGADEIEACKALGIPYKTYGDTDEARAAAFFAGALCDGAVGIENETLRGIFHARRKHPRHHADLRN